MVSTSLQHALMNQKPFLFEHLLQYCFSIFLLCTKTIKCPYTMPSNLDVLGYPKLFLLILEKFIFNCMVVLSHVSGKTNYPMSRFYFCSRFMQIFQQVFWFGPPSTFLQFHIVMSKQGYISGELTTLKGSWRNSVYCIIVSKYMFAWFQKTWCHFLETKMVNSSAQTQVSKYNIITIAP